jgi:hypothetical protein
LDWADHASMKGGCMNLQRGRVMASYGDGLRAVERAAAGITDWAAATACTEWRAVDLAGHLLAVVEYYHGLLDAAAAGCYRTGLPVGADLRAMNERDLAALPDNSGPVRVTAFLAMAGAYAQRLTEADWEESLGEWEGMGTLTVGEHTGLVIGEWHLHAWDLARCGGRDHRPADPETVAAGRAALGAPMPSGDPWMVTLTSSGRRQPVPDEHGGEHGGASRR